MFTGEEAIKFSHREVDEMKEILKWTLFAKLCNESKDKRDEVVAKNES